MADTVHMHNPETGVSGDYHRDEVDNMKSHGFRVDESAPSPLPPPPVAAAKPQLSMPNKRKD